MPEAYVHARPKARKAHKCCECHGVISKGEIYHRHSGIWDGEPGRWKRCTDCEDLVDLIDSCNPRWDERVPFGGLYEFAYEEGGAVRETFEETKRRRRST